MSNTPGPESAAPAGDARALQLRLLREIGVGAVAAALADELAPTLAATDRPLSATVVGQKKAA